MAIVTGGPVYVPNPTPQTLRYGLFTVATGPLDLPNHGGDAGVTWLAASCGEALGFEVHCVVDSTTDKGPFTDSLDIPTGAPFVVTAGFECGPVGISLAERNQLVLQKLIATEQAAVEKIFSEGTFGIAPSLSGATPAATDVGPATNITEAFSQLEENFYNTYGYPGVIHLPHSASAPAENARIMSMQGRIWRTAAGTSVSIGNYSGLSPATPGDPPPAGSTWIYITPPVTIWRASDPFISPIEGALDRTTNEVTMIAEREYVLAFDPCPVFATLTDLVEGS